MLTFNVDFLSQSIRQEDHRQMTGFLPDIKDNSTKTPDLPPMDRSAGSPHSLRSETSSESPDSITDMLLSLQKQADIISDVTKAETQKPGHSYIALISMAILSSIEKKMLLGEIYHFIMREFPYYNNQEKAWRNSVRHNLSTNECFIKNGRADNGKGNYWSIHPACVDDIAKGDFRRRQARRRARKGAKCVNTSQIPASQSQRDAGYVPMTSSSFGYPPLMPSLFGYQSMTSSPVGYWPMTSLPHGYHTMPSTSTRSPSPQDHYYSPYPFLPHHPYSYQTSPPAPSNIRSDVCFPQPLATEHRTLSTHLEDY